MRIILTVSDNELARLLREVSQTKGCDVIQVETIAGGLSHEPDLVFAEWNIETNALPLLEGLKKAASHQPPVPVVVFVPRGTTVYTGRALAAGATDVLLCPADPEEISAELQELASTQKWLTPNKRLLFDKLLQTDLVGQSSVFRRCLIEIQRAAVCDANVLLLGETGTGKEVVARAIHNLSRRSQEPYVAVNCAGLPASLLESELFGHVKGAFTGADHSRQGRFSVTGAGTLLLDEIADIQPALQTKLLRVIETRSFELVGDNSQIDFHGRLISATSVDLQKAIKDGRFRPDLLGRINQFGITLPPLRDRRDDIAILARHFLVKHSRGRVVQISTSTMELLETLDYPMNIRQLENTIIGGIARCYPGDLILPKHLPPELLTLNQSKSTVDFHIIRVARSENYQRARETVAEAIDGIYLEELLKRNEGNQSAAATEAGIDRKTFAQRIKAGRVSRDENILSNSLPEF